MIPGSIEEPEAADAEAPSSASDGQSAELRAAVRDHLNAGMTPDQIFRALGGREVWLMAIEEEARHEGTLNAIEPTPENVAALTDVQNLRWERIAVRVLGDPKQTGRVKSLYDQARGAGASRRSYTGRGRRFADME